MQGKIELNTKEVQAAVSDYIQRRFACAGYAFSAKIIELTMNGCTAEVTEEEPKNFVIPENFGEVVPTRERKAPRP